MTSKFRKIHIKEVALPGYGDKTEYIISIPPKAGYKVYFTDEVGNQLSRTLENEQISFDKLPKPLLKQVK